MPKQVLPTQEGIDFLSVELVGKRNFFPRYWPGGYYKTTKDGRAIPPRPRMGAELSFVYKKEDLEVTVWTTWVPSKKGARKKDQGWILIKSTQNRGKHKEKYFVPLNRTKYFIERILMEAKIARLRVRKRPVCPECNTPMEIAHGGGRGSHYWRCSLRHARESWDTPAFLASLPEDARRYLAERRRKRKRYQARRRKAGKPIRQIMLMRKPWRPVKLPAGAF